MYFLVYRKFRENIKVQNKNDTQWWKAVYFLILAVKYCWQINNVFVYFVSSLFLCPYDIQSWFLSIKLPKWWSSCLKQEKEKIIYIWEWRKTVIKNCIFKINDKKNINNEFYHLVWKKKKILHVFDCVNCLKKWSKWS